MDLDKLSTPEAILVRDPLSNSTRTSKRNLLFFTVSALVAVAYGSDSIRLPITGLPGTALVGAIGCVIVYQLVSFLWGYITDVQGWHMGQRNTIGEVQLRALQKLSSAMDHSTMEQNLREVDEWGRHHMENINTCFNKTTSLCLEAKAEEDIKTLLNGIKELISSTTAVLCAERDFCIKRLDLMDERIVPLLDEIRIYKKIEKKIAREAFQLRVIHFSKIYFWEGFIPVTLSIVAITKTWNEIKSFIAVVL